MGLINKGWYGLFVACGIWYLADVSSVSPSSELHQSVNHLLSLKELQIYIILYFIRNYMYENFKPSVVIIST